MRELGEREKGKRKKSKKQKKVRKQKPVLDTRTQRDELDERKRGSFVLDKSVKEVGVGRGGRGEGELGSIEGKL